MTLIFATYSITDKRKESVSFAGPYFIAGQDLLVRADNSDITGPDSLAGKKALLGHRLHLGTEDQGQGARGQPPGSPPTPSVWLPWMRAPSMPSPPTTPSSPASPHRSSTRARLKVVGNTFSEERYGVGLKKGDKALCEQVNAALKKMVDSGEWQKAVDANLGPAGFKPGAGCNPPAADACSDQPPSVCRPLTGAGGAPMASSDV